MIETGIIYEEEWGRYCFDGIEYCDRDAVKHIVLTGWQYLNDNRDLDYVTALNGSRLKMKVIKILRPDIDKLYPGQEDVKEKGFSVDITFGKEMPAPDAVFTFGREGMEPLIRYTIEQLGAYRTKVDDRLDYVIDQLRAKDGEMWAVGWALSEHRSEGEYRHHYALADVTVEDDKGNVLDTKFERKNRSDVIRVHRIDEEMIPAGFKVTWKPVEGCMTYHIYVRNQDKGQQGSYDVDVKELLFKERERKRVFTSRWDMWRHMNATMLSDDWYNWRKNGWKEYRETVKERFVKKHTGDYMEWRKNFLLTKKDIREQKQHTFAYSPKISIIVPAFRTPQKYLQEMIDSVIAQTYSNWQLCIADGSEDPEDSHVRDTLKKYAEKDKRIVYTVMDKNLGISGNTNAALALADGDYISLLDHDDLLPVDALFEVVKALQDRDVDVVYTDEDKVNMNLTEYFEPHFKPDLNIDLMRSCNYICHFFTVDKKIVDKVGGFRSEYDGSQDYDFIFRCIESAKKIHHVPRIEYHWRAHQNSTAQDPESKMYCYIAGLKAIQGNLERTNVPGKVEMSEFMGYYHVTYPVKSADKISIIIPNKDQADVLERNINSILEKTTYDNYEIVIVENNSTEAETFAYYDQLKDNPRIKIVTFKTDKGFNFSAINNYGVKQCDGDYLLFLNNDMEVQTDHWLEIMLGAMQRGDVGAVGARLFYPNGMLQHAGIVVGLGGIAAGVFRGISGGDPGYFSRTIIQQDLSAVTGACLFTSRELYEKVGGFDEELANDYNDVDLCLKIRREGKLVLFEPDVHLLHYESMSRIGSENKEKDDLFEKECRIMRERWHDILENGDPNYNPNLTLDKDDYSLR